MPKSLQQLRRSVTQQSIRGIIKATASLPIGVQRSAMGGLVGVASFVPVLRRQVERNMRLGLGDHIPRSAAQRFFRRVGWFYSSQLTVFHRGIWKTPVADEVRWDDSIKVLDEAVAEGRGVVLCSPHFVAYELMAAVIGRRHPIVMLARQAPTAERAARKTRWYSALGAELLWRPVNSSSMKDAVAYLKIFKARKVLLITPDLLADADDGVDVSLFGRRARIKSGAFALAVTANAPLVRFSMVWQSDSSIVMSFDRAPRPECPDRNTAIREYAQDWCRWFEQKLRAAPEIWLFWLDKRWSRFLRETPRTEI